MVGKDEFRVMEDDEEQCTESPSYCDHQPKWLWSGQIN